MLGWLKDNSGSLLLSILLSLTIWIVAVQQQNPIEQRDFPDQLLVETIGLPATLVISGNHIRATQMSLRAPQSTWNTITSEDISITADLSGLSSGTHDVPLIVQFDQRVQATNIRTEPNTIRITLEELRTREMPVRITLEDQPPVGFSADDPVVEPATLTLSGPASLVDRVSEVSVTVNLSDQRETIERQVTPRLLDSDGRPVGDVQVSPIQVQMTVPITQKPDFKEVTIIARHEGTPARGYYLGDISVTPLVVTLQGPPNLLNQLPDFIETPHVDLTSVSDNFTQRVELSLPEEVVVAGDTPIDVQVDIEAFQGSVAVQRIPQVEGLSESLQATIAPEVVDLILSGSVSALENLTEEDVRVVVDVTDLEPGTYQLEPQVIITIDGITNQTLLPSTVDVELQLAIASSS